MAWLKPIDVSVGEGQHGGLEAEASERMFEKLGSDEDRTLQAGVPCSLRVDLDCVG